MSDAYERITWRGHTFDRMTVQAIQAAEELLGFELEIAQGSYNSGGVSASAGTHDGGGAVDVMPTAMPARVVRCLRAVGFAAWERMPVKGVWGHHVHAVLIGNRLLAPVAARQVDAYFAGKDGLKSNLDDPSWRPSPIKPYVYREDWFEMASKDELREVVREELARLFRINDGDKLPHIGNARVKSPGGERVTTLARALGVTDPKE